MTTYQIEMRPPAAKALRKLAEGDRKSAQAIRNTISDLAEQPHPHGCEQVKARPGYLRVRCGTYRVIYAVIDAILVVDVVEIGHRRDVYDQRRHRG